MNEFPYRWLVRPGEERTRLDLYLSREVPEQSRSQIQSWIRTARVLVNGRAEKTGYLVRPGDEIVLSKPEPPPEHPGPEPLPLQVLYQDSDLAVIIKPAGMVCHMGAGARSGTLVNALLYHLGRLDTGDPSRPGIVHRLDKQTSGVMVVAKNGWAHRQLSRQFKSRLVRKEYLALVHGRPAVDTATIDIPIGRDPVHRKKMSARARKSRSAITHYRVERQYGPFTLLRVHIETGRTHQVRVHLAHKGHPIVGDTLYGSNRSRSIANLRLKEALAGLPRVFLHASSLEFRHPRTEQRLSFSSPLPAELEDFLSRCEREAARTAER